MKKERFSWKKRAKGFGYAFAGIRRLVGVEHNAWLHCGLAVGAIVLGFVYDVSVTEWALIALCIGGVLMAEAMNTAIETIADRVSPGYDEAVKVCKDLAAGAVLLMAIAAATVGLLIFAPKIYASFI